MSYFFFFLIKNDYIPIFSKSSLNGSVAMKNIALVVFIFLSLLTSPTGVSFSESHSISSLLDHLLAC